MALAIHFDGLLREGVVKSYRDIAWLLRITPERVTQVMNLLLLAPDNKTQEGTGYRVCAEKVEVDADSKNSKKPEGFNEADNDLATAGKESWGRYAHLGLAPNGLRVSGAADTDLRRPTLTCHSPSSRPSLRAVAAGCTRFAFCQSTTSLTSANRHLPPLDGEVQPFLADIAC